MPKSPKLILNCAQIQMAKEIFGDPDDMKFHSSMTLFAHATEDNQVFTDCLQKYSEGKEDVLTLAQLRVTNF